MREENKRENVSLKNDKQLERERESFHRTANSPFQVGMSKLKGTQLEKKKKLTPFHLSL